MEAAVASALTKEVVLKLVTLLSERNKLSKGLKDDLRFIHTELSKGLKDMILCDMDEHLGDPSHSSRRPQVVSMEEMRDLAHDIEDCIDRFLPCAACEGEREAASVLRRVKKAVTGGNRSRFAAEIRKLRQRFKDAHERRVNYGVNGGRSAAGAGAAAPPAAADAVQRFPARAWAAGSQHTDAGGLLTAILRQLRRTVDVPQDQDSINNFLRTTE